MTLVAPVLGLAWASVFGGLWSSGLMSGGLSWAGLLLLALAVFFVRFLGHRRVAHVPETCPAAGDAERRDPFDASVGALTEGLGMSLGRLLDDVRVAFVLTDTAGTVLRAGNTAAALLEHGPDAQWRALDGTGTFFGLPVENPDHLGTLHGFLNGEGDTGEGLVTIAGSRRQIHWAGRVLAGSEGLGMGRMFIMRDVTAERRFEVLKSDFLATVSHELRTPLTSLRGSLQLVIGRAGALEPTDRQLLEIGMKNTEKLIGLINGLLDVDALEQGNIAFRFVTLDLRDLIAVALDALSATFGERDVRVEIESAGDLPAIHGDRERLIQVLTSLLRNAAKHAPPGSTVRVRACGRDTGLQVDVCDEGAGIPPAEQPHVFERFWRADRNSADAGTGLGLAICRAVIAHHGGQIWLESEEGMGTTFSFFLPRSIFRRDDGEAAEQVPKGRSARVLLVEDDPDASAVLRASLERCGYDVLDVPTGAQGVAAARRERPAAVVLDLLLPDISGYDVLRILKNSPDTAPVPVVVLSVKPDRELARRLGAWDVLQKPLDFEALRWSLARALRWAGRPDGCLVLALSPAVSRDVTVLASVLEGDGHKAYRASDISDLARWAQSNYPDLLVVDDDFLPDTRAEAAEALCHLVSQHRIPLVFLSTGPGDDGEGSARWVLLEKPISKEDFIEATRRALAVARDESCYRGMCGG